jgi:hypothetical protein
MLDERGRADMDPLASRPHGAPEDIRAQSAGEKSFGLRLGPADLTLARASGAPRQAPGPGGNLSARALAPFLVPQRAGDPLGLGIRPGERPPAPPDPDAYDRGREDAEYARSLLEPEERAQVDAEIEGGGYMTIDQVRAVVLENTAKGSVEAGGLDPEIMALLDARIDYKIFIAGDNIYTREGLYDHFAFHEFDVQPEAVFEQQELGVFPPREHALKGELEYVARDAGDESVDFMMIEDLVGQAARANYKLKRAPLRVAKTKIFVGKERWDDFALLQRVFRGATRVAAAQIAGGGAVGGALALLAGGAGRVGTGRLLLADAATAAAERAAREEEAARREGELRRREEALRLREEEARRAAAATQEKLGADLRRIEAMLTAVSGTGWAAARGTGVPAPAESRAPSGADSADAPPGAPPGAARAPGPGGDDSVAI